MPARRGRHRKPPRVIGDPSIEDGFGVWVPRFLEWMKIRNYSPRTVGNRESYLAFFVDWCSDRSLTKPTEITKPILERYQRHLFYYRQPSGKPLSFRAQHARLIPIRAFYRWLAKEGAIDANPAADLELPRLGRRLPPPPMTHDEVEQVMAEADLGTIVGIRDRAIMEVFYSTGIRRQELTKLKLFDLDAERGTVMIREGKGDKDRMLPIAERAVLWVQKYLEDARPSLVVPPDEGWLFLTTLGEGLAPDWLTQRVRGYVKAADIGKVGACHLFRHTMATLMLDGGADVRYVQEMLGHVNLDSTQIYTQVSIRKLKAIHQATHPGAALRGRRSRDGDDGDIDPDPSPDDLLGALEAEAEAESNVTDGDDLDR